MQDKRKLQLPNGYWTCKNRLCMIGIGFAYKLIQQLLQSAGRRLSYKKKRIIMMRLIITRVYSNWMASVRDKAAKEAKELCASGRCAEALVPLQLAIDLGHLPSRALMAWLLLEGREGVAKDHDGAFQLVEEGTRLGCHHCQGVMADCYASGRGIRIDIARSLELALKSSGLGSKYGQHVLARLHLSGEEGVAQDHAKAVMLFRLAAEKNLDDAVHPRFLVLQWPLRCSKHN